MSKKMLVLPGDGAGPEMVSSAVSILELVAGDRLEIKYGDIGQAAFVKTSQYLPAETVDLATDADIIIAGIVTDAPSDRNYQNPILVLKRQLNLYSVVRRFYPLCHDAGRMDIDLILVNGNQNALPSVTETESLDGIDTHKFLSTASVKRLFQMALRTASVLNRKKMTCAHRGTMFPALDGMFVDVFYKELAGSGLFLEDVDVEDVATRLVMDPTSMDVIVSSDIYGTVLAGIASGLVGGNHLMPAASIGDNAGLFEPEHMPDLKTMKEGYVNPTSSILSGIMALDYLGMSLEAEKVRKAVRSVYDMGKTTPDIGGTATTKEFTESVMNAIRNEQ
ncbi:MAG: hypothetical protein LBR42_05010 [Candidatus Methanoplasma sp.]|jgi:isocitrate/isopropylmalate dehydrogenase|nr:hypothetical protein [Candidatus Methanoplasma sp.]